MAGEHSVVYGKPAIILPIDKFSEVKIGEMGEISLPATLRVARRAGEMGEMGEIRVINTEKDKQGLVKFTVKNFLQEFKIKNPPALQIEINSDIPVGQGFGSSAAVITAMVKGLADFFSVGVDPYVDPSVFLDFCISCENLIHKKSSGADIYACWFGKPLWFRKEGENLKLFREIGKLGELREMWENIFLIDTGRPVESTGEMVAIAAKLKNSRPNFFERQINKIEKSTIQILNTFTSNCYHDLDHDSRTERLAEESLSKIEKCLEKIGVVSEKTKNFMKDLRVRGIPAKICGAGGCAKGSGVAIVFTEKKQELEEIVKAYKFQTLDVKLAI